MFTNEQIVNAIDRTLEFSDYVNVTKRTPEKAYQAVANGFPFAVMMEAEGTYDKAVAFFKEREALRLEILKTFPQEILYEAGSLELLFYGKLSKKAIEMLKKYKEDLSL